MQNLLQTPLIRQTRRNHALEHATIHILSARFPNRPLAGHSNPTGFFLLGDVPTEHLRQATNEALVRLKNGERDLAIHPGCGTNYVVGGGLAALFAFLGMSGTKNNRQRWERLPMLAMLLSLTFIAGQRLGPALQNGITTEPDPGELAILNIYPVAKNIHRVVTRA
ncbi:MAG: hypothetical protein Fur0016_10720 [Anaerolineales bacterium]